MAGVEPPAGSRPNRPLRWSPPNFLYRPFNLFRGTWERRNRWGGKWYYLEVLFLGLSLVAVPYFSVNHIMDAIGYTAWDPEMPWDRAIPVVPWMIIPYMTLFILNPLPIFIHPTHERGRMELLLSLQAIATLTIFSCLFFIFLPAEIDMRDQISPTLLSGGDGFISSLFIAVHTTDTPWNSWPSLHISQSLVLMMVLHRWFRRDWGGKYWSTPLLVLLWVNWGFLIISILTTKQHYLWDLATGLLVGCVWWLMLSRGLRRLDSMSEADIITEFTV